jgi:hypothetical protein
LLVSLVELDLLNGNHLLWLGIVFWISSSIVRQTRHAWLLAVQAACPDYFGCVLGRTHCWSKLRYISFWFDLDRLNLSREILRDVLGHKLGRMGLLVHKQLLLCLHERSLLCIVCRVGLACEHSWHRLHIYGQPVFRLAHSISLKRFLRHLTWLRNFRLLGWHRLRNLANAAASGPWQLTWPSIWFLLGYDGLPRRWNCSGDRLSTIWGRGLVPREFWMPRSNKLIFAFFNFSCWLAEDSRNDHLVGKVLFWGIWLVIAVHVPVGFNWMVAIVAMSSLWKITHDHSLITLRLLVHLRRMCVEKHICWASLGSLYGSLVRVVCDRVFQ